MKLKTSLMLVTALLFLSLFFQSDQGLAKEKNVYTLRESVAEAMANNWSLKAKKQIIDQATYAKKQAWAGFLPKFSTTYGYTRLDKVQKSSSVRIGPGMVIPGRELNTKDNYQWTSTISQPLFTGFALISAYRLAELGIDISEMEVELEKLNLALNVNEAYFGILKADKAVGVAEKATESLESHVKMARSFYKVGMIPINDLLKAEVELANAQHDLVKARNASRLARSAFNIVLARPIDAPVHVEDILSYRPERGDPQNYQKKAFENRPEIKVLEFNILQVEQDIRLAKSSYYPEIGIQYDYIKEGNDPDVSGSSFHDSSRWQVMAGLSWTLWEWGKTHYSVREKQGFKKELVDTKSALEDSIRLELKDAMLALEVAEKNIPATRKAVEQAEENLRVSQERYKAQVTTSTEVLDAQTLLTQARTNHYNALYDQRLAWARLQRAFGVYDS